MSIYQCSFLTAIKINHNNVRGHNVIMKSTPYLMLASFIGHG